MGFFLTIVALVVALGLAWRYLGSYMAAVFDGRVHYLGWAERPVYRLLGTGPEHEQTWKRYAGSLVIFSAVFIGVGYLLLRIQGSLPLNPQHLGAVHAGAQLQHGRVVPHQHQLAELRRRDDHVVLLPDRRAHSAAVREPGRRHRRGHRHGAGLCPAEFPHHRQLLGRYHPLHALHPPPHRFRRRHHGRRPGRRADPGRAGKTIHDALNGVTQTIARGPAGFMCSIMQLGTNGGGFFNVDLAHPFENPTAFTNLLFIWLTLSIPFALTYTFGKMVGSIRHGAALLAAMVLIFGVWVGFTSYAEHTNNPAVVAAGMTRRPRVTPRARRSASATRAAPCSTCR